MEPMHLAGQGGAEVTMSPQHLLLPEKETRGHSMKATEGEAGGAAGSVPGAVTHRSCPDTRMATRSHTASASSM